MTVDVIEYHTAPSSASHLLMNTVEVLEDVVHAAFLQHLTRMGLSETVNPHTVHLVHLTLHESTTGLPHSHHIQQIGCCQQSLHQITSVFSTHPPQAGCQGRGRGERLYLHVCFGNVDLGCVGIAHQHANHLRLHSIDGNPLLLGLDQVSGEHCLRGMRHFSHFPAYIHQHGLRQTDR